MAFAPFGSVESVKRPSFSGRYHVRRCRGAGLCLLSIFHQQDRSITRVFRLGRSHLFVCDGVRTVSDALRGLLADAIGVLIQPEHGCDDDGWITHLAVRRAGPFDRCPLPRCELLPVAEYDTSSWRGALSALLPSVALGVHVGPTYLGDAAYRVHVRR